MGRLKKMRQEENRFVEQQLGSGPICGRCGATLANFDEVCTAMLDDPCEGFNKIDAAKAEFRGRGANDA